jgi:hypothetical protein
MAIGISLPAAMCYLHSLGTAPAIAKAVLRPAGQRKLKVNFIGLFSGITTKILYRVHVKINQRTNCLFY